ncbi:MAG: hypothetical protein AB7E79_06975 [Rhodospirillaceae bacterium]
MRFSILALIWMCCFAPLAAHALEKPNVLVMGLDAQDQRAGTTIGVVARDTRVFAQVMQAIGSELESAGFDVFDERAVTIDSFKQNRIGRTEGELLDIARTIQRPPMDAVVIFTIYAGAKKLAYTTEVYARITARIVNVRTGQKIGGFEVNSPRGWRASLSCERDCLLEALSRHTKTMGTDLGGVLSQQLAALAFDKKPGGKTGANSGLPTAYTLVFDGFTPDDISGVEEYLVAFNGYKLHRPVTTAPRGAEFWYEIDSDSARLNRNLRMMLDRVGVEGRISFSSIDNTFTIEKVAGK